MPRGRKRRLFEVTDINESADAVPSAKRLRLSKHAGRKSPTPPFEECKDESVSPFNDAYESEYNYGSHYYWYKRYTDTKNAYFEWYYDFESLQHLFSEQILDHSKRKETPKILIIGVGSSTLALDMADNGYNKFEFVNIDYCENVILYHNTLRENERNSKQFKNSKNVKYINCDATYLRNEFSDESFDYIIDKATIDGHIRAMIENKPETKLAQSHPSKLNIKSNVNSNNQSIVLQSMLSEIGRVLKNGGKFISVTAEDLTLWTSDITNYLAMDIANSNESGTDLKCGYKLIVSDINTTAADTATEESENDLKVLSFEKTFHKNTPSTDEGRKGSNQSSAHLLDIQFC